MNHFFNKYFVLKKYVFWIFTNYCINTEYITSAIPFLWLRIPEHFKQYQN